MGLNVIPETGTLKMAKFKKATTDGVAVVLFKIPGEFNPNIPTRVIQGGKAKWETSSHVDDWVEVYVVDQENITQQGVGALIASYTDTDVTEEAERGWYMLDQELELEALAGMGRLPGNMYLKIIFHTGNNRTDTIRGNLIWGDPS